MAADIAVAVAVLRLSLLAAAAVAVLRLSPCAVPVAPSAAVAVLRLSLLAAAAVAGLRLSLLAAVAAAAAADRAAVAVLRLSLLAAAAVAAGRVGAADRAEHPSENLRQTRLTYCPSDRQIKPPPREFLDKDSVQCPSGLCTAGLVRVGHFAG